MCEIGVIYAKIISQQKSVILTALDRTVADKRRQFKMDNAL
jgi:hypothetical protein